MHDMFDLIGLPVTSMGLLNYVFDTRTRSSSRRKCQLDTKSVMRAAIKWRGKRSRPKTAQTHDKYQGSCSHERNKPNRRETVVSEGMVKTTSSWSNGKNWHLPESSEGDWVLVYPQLLPASNRIRFSRSARNRHRTSIFNTDEIRQVVSSVVSFLKIAKEVFEGNSNATPDHLNARMTLYLKSDAEIWVPPLP